MDTPGLRHKSVCTHIKIYLLRNVDTYL
jgi:hypothetical protein